MMSWISILAALVSLFAVQTAGSAAFAQMPFFLQERNEILVVPGRQVVWNGTTLSVEQLREKLEQAKALDPSFRVSVRGDLGALYFDTTTVSDMVEEIGVAVARRLTRNVVAVQKSGQVILNGFPVPVSELRERLQQAKSADPSFKVAIVGRSDLSYSDVKTVLDIADEIGVTVGLAVKPITR